MNPRPNGMLVHMMGVLYLFIIAVLAPCRANAQQVTYEGCRDINNFAVASVLNNSIPDVAVAAIFNGNPVIYYNTISLSWLHFPTRLFLYAHECGHHALGHVLRNHTPGDEQEADCWGIVKMKDLNRLSDSNLNIIQQDLTRFGRPDVTHLSGPERARRLRACLDDGERPDSPDEKKADEKKAGGHWEVTACVHPVHPDGDVSPCRHVCGYNAYGRPFPCHPAGDVNACQHPTHPKGDREWVPD